MEEPDLKKYAQEVNQMQVLPAASVELPPLAALAIISHIQLAIRHPGIADYSEFAKIAIDVAKQLQNLFNPESETFKVLEMGWNPEHDSLLIPTTEIDVCEEPCEKLLADLPCPCTDNNKIIELVAAGDEEIPPQTLAAGAAILQRLRRNLESHGFELLDM